MEKRIVIAILTFASFFLATKGGEFFKLFDWYEQLDRPVRSVVYKIVWYVLFPLFILGLFHGRRGLLKEAGLSAGRREGLLVGFFGTLPMLLGAGWLAKFNLTIDLSSILSGCVLAALGEEILYRGFLFGQLFRHARWGFLPAGLIGAVIFGSGHLYQSSDPATLAGIFLATFLGGLWFSWLYIEWDDNLWVPISFHFFMNLSWNLFDVSENALGPWAPNIFRVATIILSIVMTIRRRRRSAQPLIIRGRRWLADRPDAGSAPVTQIAMSERENRSAEPSGFLLLSLFLLLPAGGFGQAQRMISGHVADDSGAPLSYVNIGIIGTPLGTVSGPDGSFQLFLPMAQPGTDTLRFSMVGHQSRSFLLDRLFLETETPLAVTLPQQAIDLAEVVVRPRLTKSRRFGMERTGADRSVNFAISAKPNQNLGAEIGRKFRLPGKEAALDTFRFFVSRNNFDTVRFRINVYDLPDGKPGGNLIRENILIELTGRKTGWIRVDLTPYALVFSEKAVAIAVEWIYHSANGRSLSLPIALPNLDTHFYKFGSQGNWKKFPGMSTAMALDVRYE